MKRRVAIVRAMMSESDVVFMDEPFTGLDPELKTPASNNLITGSSFGIVFGAPVLLLVSFAASKTIPYAPIITVGIALVYLTALMLFIFKLGGSKKKS